MSIGPVSNLPFSYLESFLGLGANNKTTSSSPGAANQTGTSTFGQIFEQLGQLQQSDPAQYQQLMSQISSIVGAHTQGQSAGSVISSLHQSLAAFNSGRLQNIALDPMGMIVKNL